MPRYKKGPRGRPLGRQIPTEQKTISRSITGQAHRSGDLLYELSPASDETPSFPLPTVDDSLAQVWQLDEHQRTHINYYRLDVKVEAHVPHSRTRL